MTLGNSTARYISPILRDPTHPCRTWWLVPEYGNRYGYLSLLVPITPGGRLWRAICDCGSICTVAYRWVVTGRVKSCGCLRRQTTRELRRKQLEQLAQLASRKESASHVR